MYGTPASRGFGRPAGTPPALPVAPIWDTGGPVTAEDEPGGAADPTGPEPAPEGIDEPCEGGCTGGTWAVASDGASGPV